MRLTLKELINKLDNYESISRKIEHLKELLDVIIKHKGYDCEKASIYHGGIQLFFTKDIYCEMILNQIKYHRRELSKMAHELSDETMLKLREVENEFKELQ